MDFTLRNLSSCPKSLLSSLLNHLLLFFNTLKTFRFTFSLCLAISKLILGMFVVALDFKKLEECIFLLRFRAGLILVIHSDLSFLSIAFDNFSTIFYLYFLVLFHLSFMVFNNNCLFPFQVRKNGSIRVYLISSHYDYIPFSQEFHD